VIVYSSRADEIPAMVTSWKGDYVISYLAQWIIPAVVLDNAREGGINLHPGSPEYPGIGCTNFAIYDGAKEFGITCHYMLPKVDTGGIIKVSRFPIHENDTVYSITQRCYAAIIGVFFELVDELVAGKRPALSGDTWQRLPYTRKQLNALCRLSTDMEPAEMKKRIAATTFGTQPWAFFEVNGEKFYLKNETK
jgi:methionyl-tRNA formyltransferase